MRPHNKLHLRDDFPRKPRIAILLESESSNLNATVVKTDFGNFPSLFMGIQSSHIKFVIQSGVGFYRAGGTDEAGSNSEPTFGLGLHQFAHCKKITQF
jgi:hypothetical protein